MSRKFHIIYWLQLILIVLGLIDETLIHHYGTRITIWWGILLAELFLLNMQWNMPLEKIYYKKSCLFALLDLVSVIVFLSLLIINTFFSIEWKIQGIAMVVLAYTLVRKIYIYKNFSYEK